MKKNYPKCLIFDASAFHTKVKNGLNRYTADTITALQTIDKLGWRLELHCSDQDFCQALTTELNLVNAMCQSAGINNTKNIYLIKNDRLYQNNLQGNLSRLVWHQTVLPLRVASVARSSRPYVYSPVPEGMLFPNCPQIITVHDLLPIKFPDVYPRVKYYFRWILPRLLQASQLIIASSEHTKQDLLKTWSWLKTPIQVLPIPYRSDLFSPLPPQALKKHRSHLFSRYSLPITLHRYLLCVGETRPYKNIRRAIAAFAKIAPQQSDLGLVIVGQLNRLDTDLIHLPAKLSISKRVHFVGRVHDLELADLYRGATAFIFPSLYEGFGIPPLEAMACGCPVICSTAASLPEVCGTAAEAIDPYQVEAIAQGILNVTTNPNRAQQLRQLGLDRVKLFQPEQFQQRLQAIITNLSN